MDTEANQGPVDELSRELKLATFASKCKLLLDEAVALAKDVANTQRLITLFASLTASLEAFVNEPLLAVWVCVPGIEKCEDDDLPQAADVPPTCSQPAESCPSNVDDNRELKRPVLSKLRVRLQQNQKKNVFEGRLKPRTGCALNYRPGNLRGKRGWGNNVYNTRVKCEICGLVLKNKYNFQRHVQVLHAKKEHNNEGPLEDSNERSHLPRLFVCSCCCAQKKQKHHLYLHIIRKHTNHGGQDWRNNVYTTPVTCEICGLVLKNKYNFQRHMRVLHSSAGALFRRKQRKQRLERKMKAAKENSSGRGWGNNVYNTPVECEICGLVLKNTYNFQRHVKMLHSDDGPRLRQEQRERRLERNLKSTKKNPGIHCEICNTYLTNKYDIHRHMRSLHLERNSVCERCGFKTHSRAKLEQHISEGCPVFQCATCGRLKRSQKSLLDHLRTHKETPYFTCETCGMQLKSMTGLRKHMRGHNKEAEPKLICEQCGWQTWDILNLKVHMNSHLTERIFSCSEADCSAKFKTKSLLRRHVRHVHQKVRNCRCEICGKAQTSPYYLKLHMMSHGAEKPHRCHLCSHAFPKQYKLKEHLRNVHRLTIDGIPPKPRASAAVAERDASARRKGRPVVQDAPGTASTSPRDPVELLLNPANQLPSNLTNRIVPKPSSQLASNAMNDTQPMAFLASADIATFHNPSALDDFFYQPYQASLWQHSADNPHV